MARIYPYKGRSFVVETEDGQFHTREKELYRLVGSGLVANGIAASFTRDVDCIFDRAFFAFTRSETKSIRFYLREPTWNQEFDIVNKKTGAAKFIVEGGYNQIIPSNMYVVVEISGVTSSGYGYYGVFVERL